MMLCEKNYVPLYRKQDSTAQYSEKQINIGI